MAILAAICACPAVRADVLLGGDVGIGKRYRPDGWIPVTVYVRKTDSEVVHGQVQAYADPDPAKTMNARTGMVDHGPPPAVFSTPTTLDGPAGSTQSFRLYVRNIDPVEDNLTLRYRTGDERGDGAVLAQVHMNGSGLKTNLGGLPVDGDDPWFLSVAADPSAFSFLNGRRLGLVHTHSGARIESAVPPQRNFRNPSASFITRPTVQVTLAGASDLPDKAAGYEGVDAVLLRCDAPLAGLTEAQTDALRGWVASGGHLLVTAGADPTGLTSSFLHDLLPASVNPVTRNVPFTYSGGSKSIGEVAVVSILPKPLPGVRVLASSGGAPLIVAGPYGDGLVTVTAFDPTASPFRVWLGDHADKFWRDAVTGGDTRPSSILAYVAGREEGDPSYLDWGNHTQLANALLRVPSLDAPEVGSVALFLVVYIVVLVPLNYLILKRLDRREWAWITIPVLVVLFAGATYAIGYSSKGGQMLVNRVSIAETNVGSSAAGVYSVFGIFAPHRNTYEIGVDDDKSLLCQPNTFRSSYFGGSDASSDLDNAAPAQFLEGASEPRIQNATVNMWAMRTFDISTSGDLGGAVTLRPSGQGQSALLTNGTAYRLTDCWFCYGGRSQSIGSLPPGANAPVSLLPDGTEGTQSGGRPNGPEFPQTAFRDVAGLDESQTDQVGPRMKSAVVEFLSGLGDNNDEFWGASTFDEPHMPYAPRPGEAIFAGWAEGSGPLDTPIAIDGGAAAGQNSLTLVIVHIPVDSPPAIGGAHVHQPARGRSYPKAVKRRVVFNALYPGGKRSQ